MFESNNLQAYRFNLFLIYTLYFYTKEAYFHFDFIYSLLLYDNQFYVKTFNFKICLNISKTIILHHEKILHTISSIMDEYICGVENLLNKGVINLIKYSKKFKRFCKSIIDYNFKNNWNDNFKNNLMIEWFS